MAASDPLDSLAKAANELRVLNGIAVVGAGMSFEVGMPLAGQLAPLVWQTLDEFPSARSVTAHTLGVPDQPGKNLVGDAWSRVACAFRAIGDDPNAQSRFQEVFARLNESRRSRCSPAHEALARLVHARIIEHVVSLNWDTLLEDAYLGLYGVPINAHGPRLSKPHGDAADPSSPWVLPDEPGMVPDDLVALIHSFVIERPRTLIVIGYSERDRAVVDRLIGPLDARWRVVRVGPNTSGPDSIRLSADAALAGLAERLCHDWEHPEWRHLTFAKQRGIEYAIAGERLGQADVKCCPLLPQAQLVRERLDRLNYAIIDGPPGCGKSITAYQVADLFRGAGWEVLLLNQPVLSESAALRAAQQGLGRRLLMVDDGQTLSERFRNDLIDLAGGEVSVLIALTEPDATNPQSVRISRSSAVEAIAKAYLERRDEVLPIVSRYDNWVSDRYADIPIERRIKEAAESESPWQFNFVLRGGWRTAREALTVLRDDDRADLMLLALAVHQVTNLDAATQEGELASSVAILSRSPEWFGRSLSVLRNRRHVLPGEGLRCPHIHFALYVIRWWFQSQSDEMYSRVVEMIRAILSSSDTPLRGVSWLLHELRLSDAFRSNREDGLIDEEVADHLYARSFNSVSPESRRDAAFVLSALIDWTSDARERLSQQSDLLGRWVEEVDDANAYSYGSLLNNLWNFEKYTTPSEILKESRVDPSAVAERIKNASHASGYGWGYFLNRLFCASESEWRRRLIEAIDRDHILRFCEGFSPVQLEHLAQFLNGLAYFDNDLGFEALERSLPAIKKGLLASPLESWEDLKDVLWYLLGHPPRFLRRDKPQPRQKKASRKIAAFIPVERTAADISGSRRRDWERYAHMVGDWLDEVDRERSHQIAHAVDLDRLDQMTKGCWSAPPRELRLLISMLATKNGEPARSWVSRHASEIDEVDPITAIVSPETALKVLASGGSVVLHGHNGHDWGLQAAALARIAAVDRGTARLIAEKNLEQVAF